MSVEQLENLAKSRFDHRLHRCAMRERLEQQLVVAHGGGVFKASPELISFVSCWDTDELYLMDQYENPVKIDRVKFLVELKEAYQCAMNLWHQEFEDFKKVRKGSDV